MNSNKTLQTISLKLEDIETNPFNKELDNVTEDESIRILAMSIKTVGLMQPLIVYKNRNKYTLVAGHKRLKAIQMLKWPEVPCMVIAKPKDDDKEQILMAYANQYRSTPQELEKMVELAERTWNSMNKETRHIYIDRYKKMFEEKFKDNKDFLENKREFAKTNFSARCDFIREVTGLTKSNATVKRVISSIRDKELGKDKSLESDEIAELKDDASKAKGVKVPTAKSILKQMNKLADAIDIYCQLPDAPKNHVIALTGLQQEFDNVIDALETDE